MIVHEIAFSAPGRCGIIGNPSDIYGGFVVSCSVPVRNRCVLRKVEGQGSKADSSQVLWDAVMARFPLEGWDFEWTSNVPRSSGLAGSTALLAATLASVLTARGEPPKLDTLEGKSDFAELVRDLELNEAGVVCGYQDAYMAVHGGLNALDYAGKHPIEPGPVGTVTPFEGPLPFLLITTGVERLSGSVHGPMRDRWLAGDREVIEAMARIAELGRVGHRAMERGDIDTLAEAMNENQRIIAGLGGSGEAIDALIAACRKHGALAAKLAGAGMGGTVIALALDPNDLQSQLEQEGHRRYLQPKIVEGLRHETGVSTSEN